MKTDTHYVIFPNNREMGKALDIFIHKVQDGFTGVGEHTLAISDRQFKALKKAKVKFSERE
jgi:hypothetical protein